MTPSRGLARDISNISLTRPCSKGPAFDSLCPYPNYTYNLEHVNHTFISLLNASVNANNTKEQMKLIKQHNDYANPNRAESCLYSHYLYCLACITSLVSNNLDNRTLHNRLIEANRYLCRMLSATKDPNLFKQ